MRAPFSSSGVPQPPNEMRLSRGEESEPLRRAFSTSALSRGLGLPLRKTRRPLAPLDIKGWKPIIVHSRFNWYEAVC
jgi:hypothetical protein